MAKTCIFLIGTNCAGKTSVAKDLISKLGGIRKYEDGVTYTYSNIAFAGKYDVKYGGVDNLGCTRILADVVSSAFLHVDTIICEGVRLKTFGANLTRAMFLADRRHIIYLQVGYNELCRRLRERSGVSEPSKYTVKQINECESVLRKWKRYACSVNVVNTNLFFVEEIANMIYNALQDGL